jgi:hypothetical protein
LCMASPSLEVCDLTAVHVLIWRRDKRIWANWRMQFHVIWKFNWSFKLIFFASVCHPRCTSINVHDNVICKRMCLASHHLDVWKRVDRRKNGFERIGECNFMWSESSNEVSNWFFLPLCAIHAAQVYKCARQREMQKDVSRSPHLDVWRRVDLFIVPQGDHERLTERGQVNGKKIRCQL